MVHWEVHPHPLSLTLVRSLQRRERMWRTSGARPVSCVSMTRLGNRKLLRWRLKASELLGVALARPKTNAEMKTRLDDDVAL